jgi:predicted enzyme related to lactoylglutathione lyase
MKQHLGIDQQITWVYTHNLERSIRFYGNSLGLKCIRDEGSARIFETTENSMIGVCETFDDRVVEPRGSMITLVCDDVDGWYRKLVSAGAKTLGEPHVLNQFNIYTFFTEDPDGYQIEIQEFLD